VSGILLRGRNVPVARKPRKRTPDTHDLTMFNYLIMGL
jgi:hypothetical protein